MNIRQIILSVLVGILLCLLALEVPRAIAVRNDAYRWFDPIVDIRGIIVSDYVNEPDEEEMQEAMIKAMVESLDDPFCEYIRPEEQKQFRKNLSGNYVGIGARINGNAEYLKIITPMENSPALKAGLLAGDEILEIDGVTTKDQPVDDSIDKLLGEPGTKVNLLVRHVDGSEQQLEIVREPIETRSTFGLIRRDGDWSFSLDPDRNIAYIGIDSFNSRTSDELETILRELRLRDDLDGLILDVRSNPGGALTAALETADLFLKEGRLLSIRSARPERRQQERVFNATSNGTFTDIPIIVLIDDRSASASEIVAGSLKDNERAMVLGERTYGKGSVQEVRELEDDGGILKFTTAYYYLPSGRSLHRIPGSGQADWGVDPNDGYVVPETIEDYNDRYEQRLPWTVITREEPAEPRTTDPDWIRESMSDEALARAVEILGERVEMGQWPELPEQDSAGEIARRDDLEAALEVRQKMLTRMTELNSEIASLEGVTTLDDRGVELPDEVDLDEAMLVIRDRDGNEIGSWRIEEIEELKRSLKSVRLSPNAQETP
ncbi:MAG: hypothetical protein CMJ24_07950 [Phycisphaerae bacterium]|nr:hypothetical protein [Phycisphaerae bacterium]MAB83353.1 hypothetical protein [Phycisphaerae bacterium]|tara:strand:+ start:3534 stop:5180 length:1647 start_codon:yes stop_codon:yes gene_type:complete